MSIESPRRPATGLREAHAHLAALGESLTIPSLASCRSVAECLERVRQEAAQAKGGWVRLMGARIESWSEARWPTIEELDVAAGGSPCVIKSFDHHAGVAGTAALAAAGLSAGMRVGVNGEVVADARGRATGLLVEEAAVQAWMAAPAPTMEQKRGFVTAALEHLHALGYREVHDMLSQPWLGPVLREMELDGRLGMRVWLYAPVEDAPLHRERAWESVRVKLAGLKVFADGTLNSRTALMLGPYAADAGHDSGWCGKAMVTNEQLDFAWGTARRMGIGLAVHAIGDGAVRMVLDARRRSAETCVFAANGTPSLRIEHAEIVDEADVGRFAPMGVVCSVQPCHLLYDIEVLRRALPHRVERVLPLRDLIDAGCAPGELLWFGSDVPIVPADPMDSVAAATKRRREAMPGSAVIAWGQRIETAEAWRAFVRSEGVWDV